MSFEERPVRVMHSVIMGGLMAITIATPVLSADESTCLFRSRFIHWKVLDGNTVLLGDNQTKERGATTPNVYVVSLTSPWPMSNACFGLTGPIKRLVIRPAAIHACLRDGDYVRFQDNNRHYSCSVTNVRIASPEHQNIF